MYPVMLDMTGKRVLIIGGGSVALRKVQGLQNEHAEITVLSSDVRAELEAFDITIIKAGYDGQDISSYDFVFIATDDPAANKRALENTNSAQWVNDCTAKVNSNFYNVATFDYEDAHIMISTDGASPVQSKRLKEKLMTMLHINKRD